MKTMKNKQFPRFCGILRAAAILALNPAAGVATARPVVSNVRVGLAGRRFLAFTWFPWLLMIFLGLCHPLSMNGQSYQLTISATGSGTVTSSPSGINCPGNCTASFASGTSVTCPLRPAPVGISATSAAPKTSINILRLSLLYLVVGR